jgi:hypothetical protein
MKSEVTKIAVTMKKILLSLLSVKIINKKKVYIKNQRNLMISNNKKKINNNRSKNQTASTSIMIKNKKLKSKNKYLKDSSKIKILSKINKFFIKTFKSSLIRVKECL